MSADHPGFFFPPHTPNVQLDFLRPTGTEADWMTQPPLEVHDPVEREMETWRNRELARIANERKEKEREREHAERMKRAKLKEKTSQEGDDEPKEWSELMSVEGEEEEEEEEEELGFFGKYFGYFKRKEPPKSDSKMEGEKKRQKK